MEYLEMSKFVTSLTVALGTILVRFIYYLLTRNGERMKIRASSVELIDKVINEREWKNQENRLVVEESFEQLYSKPLNFQEIKVLIYSETPNAAFRTYLKYRPILEIDDKYAKFRYKKGKRPYWPMFKGKIKFPKTVIKGLLAYSAFGFPASYAMTWLASDATNSLKTKDLAFFWFLDALVWFIAIIFLIEGLKYQASEKDILRDLGDKFQINN